MLESPNRGQTIPKRILAQASHLTTRLRPKRLALVVLGVSLVLFPVALWAMGEFVRRICVQAFLASVTAMGTTVLGLLGALLYPVADLVREFHNDGLAGLKKKWGERFKYTAIVASMWWLCLFCYQAFFAIPRDIYKRPSEITMPGPAIPSAPPVLESYGLRDPRNAHHLAIERTAKFAVLIPFDTAPNSFPIPLDDNPDDPLFRTYMSIHSLASNGTIPEAARETKGNEVSFNTKPISIGDAPEFLGKLLQYYILSSIDNLQSDSITVAIGYPTEVNPGIVPPDAERYPYKKLFHDLAENPFFRPFRYRPSGDAMQWEIKSIKVPKGTTIKFMQLQNPTRYIVQFQRPNHYRVDFIVEPFIGTGVGNIPKYFSTFHASTTMQWTFLVTMHYTIEHPDDGGLNPNVYAQWLDALYDGLHKRLVLER